MNKRPPNSKSHQRIYSFACIPNDIKNKNVHHKNEMNEQIRSTVPSNQNKISQLPRNVFVNDKDVSGKDQPTSLRKISNRHKTPKSFISNNEIVVEKIKGKMKKNLEGFNYLEIKKIKSHSKAISTTQIKSKLLSSRHTKKRSRKSRTSLRKIKTKPKQLIKSKSNIQNFSKKRKESNFFQDKISNNNLKNKRISCLLSSEDNTIFYDNKFLYSSLNPKKFDKLKLTEIKQKKKRLSPVKSESDLRKRKRLLKDSMIASKSRNFDSASRVEEPAGSSSLSEGKTKFNETSQLSPWKIVYDLKKRNKDLGSRLHKTKNYPNQSKQKKFENMDPF